MPKEQDIKMYPQDGVKQERGRSEDKGEKQIIRQEMLEVDEYMDDIESVGLSDAQAQRVVRWDLEHGHSKGEAYEHLAYALGATADQMGMEIKGEKKKYKLLGADGEIHRDG